MDKGNFNFLEICAGNTDVLKYRGPRTRSAHFTGTANISSKNQKVTDPSATQLVCTKTLKKIPGDHFLLKTFTAPPFHLNEAISRQRRDTSAVVGAKMDVYSDNTSYIS